MKSFLLQVMMQASRIFLMLGGFAFFQNITGACIGVIPRELERKLLSEGQQRQLLSLAALSKRHAILDHIIRVDELKARSLRVDVLEKHMRLIRHHKKLKEKVCNDIYAMLGMYYSSEVLKGMVGHGKLNIDSIDDPTSLVTEYLTTKAWGVRLITESRETSDFWARRMVPVGISADGTAVYVNNLAEHFCLLSNRGVMDCESTIEHHDRSARYYSINSSIVALEYAVVSDTEAETDAYYKIAFYDIETLCAIGRAQLPQEVYRRYLQTPTRMVVRACNLTGDICIISSAQYPEETDLFVLFEHVYQKGALNMRCIGQHALHDAYLVRHDGRYVAQRRRQRASLSRDEIVIIDTDVESVPKNVVARIVSQHLEKPGKLDLLALAGSHVVYIDRACSGIYRYDFEQQSYRKLYDHSSTRRGVNFLACAAIKGLWMTWQDYVSPDTVSIKTRGIDIRVCAEGNMQSAYLAYSDLGILACCEKSYDVCPQKLLTPIMLSRDGQYVVVRSGLTDYLLQFKRQSSVTLADALCYEGLLVR